MPMRSRCTRDRAWMPRGPCSTWAVHEAIPGAGGLEGLAGDGRRRPAWSGSGPGSTGPPITRPGRARPARQPLLAGADGQMLAASTVAGTGTEYGIVDLALAPGCGDAEARDAVLAVLAGLDPPGGRARVCLPAPHPANRPLLVAGWHNDDLDVFMATDPALLSAPGRALPRVGLTAQNPMLVGRILGSAGMTTITNGYRAGPVRRAATSCTWRRAWPRTRPGNPCSRRSAGPGTLSDCRDHPPSVAPSGSVECALPAPDGLAQASSGRPWSRGAAAFRIGPGRGDRPRPPGATCRGPSSLETSSAAPTGSAASCADAPAHGAIERHDDELSRDAPPHRRRTTTPIMSCCGPVRCIADGPGRH